MGEPQLSNCFFQNFLEGTAQPNFHPILQLMESRAIQNQGPKQYRVRLSDGVFSYSGCTIAPVAVQYFEQDGISTQNAVIQVTNWKRADMNNKAVFNVSDYNLISTDFPVLGNPQTHDGNPDNYRNHMQANAYVKDQQQALVNQQRAQQWQQPSPVKQDPENMSVGGSTKRTRGQSPPDPRQPLTKRQPQPMSISMMPGVMPIKCITPYCNRWRICGIVSGKDAQIKDVKSTKGEFRVFGFIITDQEGTAIRVSAFGEAANKFFSMLENGQVYYIAGGMRSGSIRPANKQFNNTGHDYELTLDKDSEVTYCNEQFHAPKLRLKPVILKNIPQHVNECIDVVAVVERVGEVTQITTKKDQRQLDKRDVFLVDQTASEICFTLWGEQAQHFSLPQGAIIGIKGAIVREFGGGFSISTTSGTQIIENPDHDMTMLLFNWYRDQKPLEFKNLSMSADSSAVFERDFRLIGPILQHGINPENEKGQYFFLKAMVNAVKTEQSVYQACPNCRKKMTSDQNTYRCEKCDQSFDKPNHKMMLQVELADFTGSTWVTIFDELATTMLQVSADDLAHWMDSDRERFDRVFDQIRFHEFLFRVRVRYEQYNDQQQMKWNVFDVKPVPYEKCKQIYAKTLQHLQQMGL